MLKSDKSEPKKILVAKEKRLDQITKKHELSNIKMFIQCIKYLGIEI